MWCGFAPFDCPTKNKNHMATKKINFASNYFISEAGYVFKVEKTKEIILPIHKKPHTVNPFVYIMDKPYDLLYLMIEHFNIHITPHDSIRYKLSKNNTMPLNSIKIIKTKKTYLLEDNDAKIFNDYKCNEKATSANLRCEFKISGNDVLAVLKLYEFSCVYCSKKLKNAPWHLDHFYPLSKGGKNKIENIVPSCPRCNVMKGDLDGMQFVKWCKKVLEKNTFYRKEGRTFD
jgi:5-methylcytosine-specific restriction endonuclease McrA